MASPPPSSPLLGIRMSQILPPSQCDGMDHEDLMDCFDALITQESSYRCEDYLSRNRPEDNNSTNCLREDSKREEIGVDNNLVDASCREKMCEWSYRVCDHFKVPRNIVAVAFSFLDRFVNRCSCDRTAFKLASMTALYMATKVFNGRQLSIATLAELSRGEFEVSHIAEMEQIMLRTLDWKLNPPTVQDFVQYFMSFLPAHCPEATAIAQRAMFFSELCVYDYDLILHDRGVIALACVFNAIDAVLGADPVLANEMELLLLDAIQFRYPSCSSLSLGDRRHQPSHLVQSTQRRLWYLFSCSAQAVQEQQQTPASPTRAEKNKQLRRPQGMQAEPKSPTSVHQVASVSPISVTGGGRF